MGEGDGGWGNEWLLIAFIKAAGCPRAAPYLKW